MRGSGWFALMALAGLAGGALAHAPARNFNDAVPKIEATVDPPEVRRGQTATWKFTVELTPGWHTYPTEQPEQGAQGQVTDFRFQQATGGIFVGPMLHSPEFHTKPEPDLTPPVKALRYIEGR